jgi:hypothetical protein
MHYQSKRRYTLERPGTFPLCKDLSTINGCERALSGEQAVAKPCPGLLGEKSRIVGKKKVEGMITVTVVVDNMSRL